MIDYNEIGNSIERKYRPYLWMGEDHNSHVMFFKHKYNNVRLTNINPGNIRTITDAMIYVGIELLRSQLRINN